MSILAINSFPLSLIEIVTVLAVFVLILSGWMLVVVLWSAQRSAKRRKVEARLGILPQSDAQTRVLTLWREDGRATAVVPGAKNRPPMGERMRRSFNAAGLAAPVPIVLGAMIATAVMIGVVIFVMTQSIVLAVAVALLVLVGFRMYVLYRVGQRTAVFERQLVDAMDLAARSLRSGHPLMGAFRLVSEELSSPVNEIFHEICQQHEMGAGLEDAMRMAAAKAPTTDMSFFAASVAIQLRSGGNLADMMTRLAAVIRDRMRIGRRLRVLTAQTQLSKRILIGLPIVIFLFLNIIAGEYMSVFFTTLEGNILLGVAAAGLFLGGWLMNRMAVMSY